MTSKELLSLASEITKVTSPETPFGKLLIRISADLDKVEESTKALLPTNAAHSDHLTIFTELVKQVNELGFETRRVRLMDLFQEANAVKEVVVRFLASAGLSTPATERDPVALLAKFAFDLENYWRNHKTADAFQLMVTGERLSNELQTLRKSAAVIESSLTPALSPRTENEDLLSIFLPSQSGLQDFAAKLAAIDRIYAEFCQLFEASPATNPLKVVKIESGSFWLVVIGTPMLIQAVRTAIFNGVAYLYREYTTEGRLSQIPRRIEVAENALRLSDEMKKRGFDVSESDERIRAANALITKELNTLLGGEDAIEVDGAVHPIAPNQQRLLEGRTTLSIEDGSSDGGC